MDSEEPYGIIYIARNTITGKAYVGQTVNTLKRRRSAHVTDAARAKSGKSSGCRRFYNSVNKHGWDAFHWAELATANDQVELDALEIHYIKAIGTLTPLGYNLKEGGAKGRPSAESIERMAAAQRGKRRSPEATIRTALANTGRKRSPEARENIRRGAKRRGISPETLAKMAAQRKGKSPSEKTKNALRIAITGLKRDPESIERGAQRRRKSWIVTYPGGMEELTTNLPEFCRAHKLQATLMRQVAYGGRTHHKGFKCQSGPKEITHGPRLH